MIKVFNLKDIFKYLVGIVAIIVIIVSTTRYFFNERENNIDKDVKVKTSDNIINILKTCLSKELPVMEYVYNKDNIIESNNINILEELVNVELLMMNNIKKEESDKEEFIVKEEKIEEAKTDIDTKIIDDSKINIKYTNVYGNTKINNSSKYTLNKEMLTPNISLKNKKDIIIFHTHTCESYTTSEKYNYTATGNYRTTDKNYSVVRVGDELEKYLKKYSYNVIHDTTYHDYPSYTGSYNRSLSTVEKILKNNPTSQVIFDIHRDAIGSNSGYAPTVKIGDEYAAQLMFVIGTNGGGRKHPNWNQNLKFAIKIQEKANELYPGLFKPIILRNSRYNQHVTNAARIIEVGATGNTLDQCLISMKYLSKIISEVIK